MALRMPTSLSAIPDVVTSAMIKGGAECRTAVESPTIKLIQVRFGSSSYNALEAWISSNDSLDPNAQCIVAPTPAIAAAVMFPGLAMVGVIGVRVGGRVGAFPLAKTTPHLCRMKRIGQSRIMQR